MLISLAASDKKREELNIPKKKWLSFIAIHTFPENLHRTDLITEVKCATFSDTSSVIKFAVIIFPMSDNK